MSKGIWAMGAVMVLVGIIIAGCTSTENGKSGSSDSSTISTCPDKGFLQADVDYCVDLCMFKTNRTSTISCNSVCKANERVENEVEGSNMLQKRIAKYLCDKCGECN